MSNVSYNEYKNRKKSVTETLEQLTTKQTTKKEYPKDEKLFKYVKDKAGNAFVQIRFLPSRNSIPSLAPRYEHYFENNVGDQKRTYFENCPTTIGGQCVVCEKNKAEWKKGNQDLARQRARKQQWFVNIYVVKDSQTPENNGKVFVWKIGKKIFEKIMSAMKPTDEDVAAGKSPIDVFDLENGADFCVKVKNVGGFTNYDQSYFTDVRPIFKDEKEIEALFNSIYLLDEYVSDAAFKGEEDLQKRYNYVYGIEEGSAPIAKSSPAKKEEKAEEEGDIGDDVDEDLFDN